MKPSNELIQECLAASGGDEGAAMEAADLMSSLTVRELEELVGAPTTTNGETEHVLRGWTDEWGIGRVYSVALSNEEQRSLDRSRQSVMLATLDEALAQDTSRSAAMAVLERGWQLL